MAEYKKRKYRELTANEEDRKIVPEPYGGGGRECKVYHDTAKMCHPIRIFSHDTWNIHIPSEKKISMLGGIKHSYVTFNSLENLVPAQVSASRRTESHKKQSNTTQQNGTEMETN